VVEPCTCIKTRDIGSAKGARKLKTGGKRVARATDIAVAIGSMAPWTPNNLVK